MKTFNTIEQIQQLFQSGELTSKELTMLYLERIATYDQAGVKINSIAEINPDALHIAEALDVEREINGPRGPLHGIPVLIKDNIDTADKMHTTAGSLALENNFAAEDSFVAQQLRKAGAVILGKTNLTEWANFMTENMPNGYSSRGGQVLNPYGPGNHDVGGSSAGTGAAIAAHFATIGIGTETSGSILSPASSNSLVGIKPTLGLISRTGIIPIAHSQDTAGPMTRTVTDAAILLGVITGVDKKDEATAISRVSGITDYTEHLKADGLSGTKIGVDRHFLSELNDEELNLFNEAIEDIEAKGATIIEVELKTKQELSSVLFHEFKNGLNAYLANLSPNVPVHSLKEVIAFNEANKEKTLKYGQTLLTASEEKSGRLTEPQYIQDRLEDLKLSQTEGIDAVMNKHQLDALLFPNNFGAAAPAQAGYPSITVPAGYTPKDTKPLGITFTSLAFSEPKLIELAYAYEQKTNHRKDPRLQV